MVDRDTGRGIGFIGESGGERECDGMELVRERSRGVRVARCLTVSDCYGLRVSGGVGVECVGDVAGDSIGRDLSEVARSAVAEAVATATVGV